MSVWGGIDYDEDVPDTSPAPELFDFDLTAVLARAESEPEQVAKELQHTLSEASQNGNDAALGEILGNREALNMVNINAKDEAGSTPLIYASCFGHENAVLELIRYGADPNLQDANEWTALMWAVNNNHLAIVKQLLASNADTTIATSSGRTAFDLPMAPSSATYLYLSSKGYLPGKSAQEAAGAEEDAFYERPLDPDEVEARFSDELKESAAALGGFSATSNGFNVHVDTDDESTANADAVLPAPLRSALRDLTLDFDWDSFKVKDSFALPRELIPEFLDLVITNVTPSLQKNQAPMSANALFLATRYFYYCGTTESFTSMTSPLPRRIELVVKDERHAGDLAYLSYWLTNAEVFLYYLRKDKGLNSATSLDLQPIFESVINLVSEQIQEATHKLLLPLIAPCLLDFNSIPEYGVVEYRDEWKLFRSASKLKKDDDLEDLAQKHMLPPSHETRWKKPGPQRVASILSSLLVLFQIYGVHSVTQAQIIAKLFYFVTSRMFNKISSHRKYLNRRRAMQIRLNMSIIEDWCRNHNFRPSSVELSGTVYRYKSLIDIGRTFLAPLNQLLAWLQTFSGFGSDFTNVVSTLQELKALNPRQLWQSATHYRFETKESPLSHDYKMYLRDLTRHYDRTAAEKEAKAKQPEEHKQDQATQVTNDLLDLDGPEPPSSRQGARRSGIESCVLVSYELPVADDILLDENLELVEHIPSLEEGNAFWGDEDVSGLVESQGARFLLPHIPADIVDAVAKKMDEDAQEREREHRKLSVQDEDNIEPEEPAMASRRPVDGEEIPEVVDDIWAETEEDDLAPAW